MIKPRVGMLAFSESPTRQDVYLKRKPIWDREVERFVRLLEPSVEFVWPTRRELRSKRDAVMAVKEVHAADVDAVVLYPPIFVAPAAVAHAARLCRVPVSVVHNESPDSLSQLAFLAVVGAMDQIGLKYTRIPGDIGSDPNRIVLLAFLRAAAASQRLLGQTYGCIGGRALGISTGSADIGEWEKVFGVDIEHIDQFEIVRRAEKQSKEAVARYIDWMASCGAVVQHNETNFTPAHLEKQIRSYLATKEIVETYELDFVGLKCQPEMSNGFCLQCINVSLVNDPYDAEGAKQPIPCSCEADADGALTMQLLNLLSDGKPTNLNDITWMTENEMTLANCGSMATYFAGLSENPERSLSRVSFLPHSFGEAGGAATVFTVPADANLTLARLFRRNSRYVLGVLTGRTETKSREEQPETIRTRPLIFLRMDIDKKLFIETFGSNHIHAVEGNMKGELRCLAGILDIDFIDYDR